MIIIQCVDSQEVLMTMIKQAVAEVIHASAISADPTHSKQDWITTPILKIHLKEKGYSATSSITIKKLTDTYKIETEKRGRDLWFKLSDVLSIPSKI